MHSEQNNDAEQRVVFVDCSESRGAGFEKLTEIDQHKPAELGHPSTQTTKGVGSVTHERRIFSQARKHARRSRYCNRTCPGRGTDGAHAMRGPWDVTSAAESPDGQRAMMGAVGSSTVEAPPRMYGLN